MTIEMPSGLATEELRDCRYDRSAKSIGWSLFYALAAAIIAHVSVQCSGHD